MNKDEIKRRANEHYSQRDGGGSAPQGRILPLARRKRAISWGQLGESDIANLVQPICDSGAGLILGTTTDGGALSITILDGGTKIREYPSDADAYNEIVEWVRANYGGLGTPPATPR